MIQAAKRPLLDRPVQCPECGHQTIVDPCAHCHTYLPKAFGGRRTFSDDALGNAAADRLARLQEHEAVETEA